MVQTGSEQPLKGACLSRIHPVEINLKNVVIGTPKRLISPQNGPSTPRDRLYSSAWALGPLAVEPEVLYALSDHRLYRVGSRGYHPACAACLPFHTDPV